MKNKFILVFNLLCILFLIFSLATFWGKNIYWLDNLANFRWHYAGLGLLGLLGAFLLRTKIGIFATILIIMLNIYETAWLYIPTSKPPLATEKPLKILAINVFVFNPSPEKVIAEVKKWDADVVILQEINANWLPKIQTLEKYYPYRHLVPDGNPSGLGVWSKISAKFKTWQFVANKNRPSIGMQFQWQNQTIDLITAHPIAPISATKFQLRNQMLNEIIRQRANLSPNFILMGDLNLTGFSAHFKDLLQRAQLRDSRQGFGSQTTWQREGSWIGLAIDHCLVSPHFEVLQRKIGNAVGSDHLPIYVELALKNK
jgi:endonuclease/exonuclease/phosphatase (EEP) superfamily protein YafD